MDDSVRTFDHVMSLTQIGQVRDNGLPTGDPVGDEVDVEHVVTMLPEVSNGPAAGLAGAAGDDDPHG